MTYRPQTTDGWLHYSDEDYNESVPEEFSLLEVSAEVTIGFDAEPYEAPSKYSPGGGGICGSWVEEVYSVQVNGEDLEGWALELAIVAVQRWADEHNDEVLEACDEALDEEQKNVDVDADPAYRLDDDDDECPRYYDGTGRY